jgi:hypothetical protein
MQCHQCKTEFLQRQASQRFCSRVCSDAWHLAERQAALRAYREPGMYHQTVEPGVERDTLGGSGR